MSDATTCKGCRFITVRYRVITPRMLCTRYQRTADMRCIDYRDKKTSTSLALAFYAKAKD